VLDHDNVNQTITKSTGHFIYLEEPELVIGAVENVVNRVEKEKRILINEKK
jgi:hypothetical protein